jgi:hypothetical protein
VFLPRLILGAFAVFGLLGCASAKSVMPSSAAAMVMAAVLKKRRRSWLISWDIYLTSIGVNSEQLRNDGCGDRVNSLCRGSAERERKSLHARIEKLDLELSISDGLRLSDQLIQPLFGNRAVALGVNVNSVSSARRLSIDEHAKSHGSSSRCRSHDEMKIAGVKAVRDPPVGLVQHSGLFLHRPITRKGPMIESQLCGGGIDATLVQYSPPGDAKFSVRS